MNETCRWSDTEHIRGPIGNTCDRGTGRTRRSTARSFWADHAAGYCQVTPRTRRSFCTSSFGTRANASDGPGSLCAPISRRTLSEPPSSVPAPPNHTPTAVGQRPYPTGRAAPIVGIAARPPVEGPQSPAEPLTLSERRLFIRQRRTPPVTRKTPLPRGHRSYDIETIRPPCCTARVNVGQVTRGRRLIARTTMGQSAGWRSGPAALSGTR